MENEIVIPRSRWKSLFYSLFLFFCSGIMCLPLGEYFFDFAFMESEKEMPLFAVIICMFFIPILVGTGVFFFTQIFKATPVLVVNAQGIQYGMCNYCKEVIRWGDIETINIIPTSEYNYTIGIILKRPEKYITNPKVLARLQKRKFMRHWGHINLSTLYFHLKLDAVANLMKYYLEKSKEALNF